MANNVITLTQLDEAAIKRLADILSQEINNKTVIYLTGTLGAGKTSFSRYFIQAKGHQGAVKSPTYTLVEPYQHITPAVFHFDLYRLSDAEELEYIGVRDYFSQQAIFIIEWPDKGNKHIPPADIDIHITVTSALLRDVQICIKNPEKITILGQLLDFQ